MLLFLQPRKRLKRMMACKALNLEVAMLQRILNTAQTVYFIGAGVIRVAYGASAAAGSVEEDDAGCPVNVPPSTVGGLDNDLGHSLGNRLEAFASRGG